MYFGAVAGSYASGLCYAKFGYQVASPVSKFLHTKSLYTIVISTSTDFNWAFRSFLLGFFYDPTSHTRKNVALCFSQTVFFASCGLNTLGLIYSLFYMSNIKQEKATSSGSALEK